MKVNEIFGPTIQGEGRSRGMECIFIRTAICNLHCIWCDTAYTWNWTGTKFKHPEKYDKEKEVHLMEIQQIIDETKKLSETVKAVVITGGEPLLQQNEVVELVKRLKEDNYWVEIETNGTILPSDEFLEVIDRINCSPKLKSNGADSVRARIKPPTLKKLAQSDKTNFKFVITDKNDLIEIVLMAKEYGMKDIWLMAEGRTKKEQLQKESEVSTLAQYYGFNFTPREQVLKWGTRRKV